MNLNRSELEFFDPETLKEAVKGSALEHTQLGPGTFQGELRRVGVGPVWMDYGHYSVRVAARGALPPDRIIFALPLESPGMTQVNKRGIRGDSLVLFPNGSELDVSLSPGIKWASISMEKDYFENAMESLSVQSASGHRTKL